MIFFKLLVAINSGSLIYNKLFGIVQRIGPVF